MPLLKYEGICPSVEVGGSGHFAPGDERPVDVKTGLDMDQPHPKSEGWTVTWGDGEKPKVAVAEADEPTIAPSLDRSPRGPRASRNDAD